MATIAFRQGCVLDADGPDWDGPIAFLTQDFKEHKKREKRFYAKRCPFFHTANLHFNRYACLPQRQ